MVTDAKHAAELAAEHIGGFDAGASFRVVASDRGIACTSLRDEPVAGNAEHRTREQAAADVAAMLAAWGDSAWVGITRDPMGISVGLIRR